MPFSIAREPLRSPCADTRTRCQKTEVRCLTPLSALICVIRMGIRSYEHTRSSTDDREQRTESRDIHPTLTPTPIRASVKTRTASDNHAPAPPHRETTGASPAAKTLFTLSKNQMPEDRCRNDRHRSRNTSTITKPISPYHAATAAGLPIPAFCPLTADGGADRSRTDDLLNANQALSQLSYGPVVRCQIRHQMPGTGRSAATHPSDIRHLISDL